MRTPRLAWVFLLFTLSACLNQSFQPAETPKLGSEQNLALSVTIPWMPDSVQQWSPQIEKAAANHDVDANLIAIIVLLESNGNPQAKSPAGATGLMQLMPATAKAIATQREIPDHTRDRLLDPEYNLDLGVWYFAEQMRTFASPDPTKTITNAAGAYNAGPARFRKWLNNSAKLSSETIRYRTLVAGLWQERHDPESLTYQSMMR